MKLQFDRQQLRVRIDEDELATLLGGGEVTPATQAGEAFILRCTLQLHVQDGEIVKATSPLDHSVTLGNLCVKGRFGWRYVQNVAPPSGR